MHDLGQSIDQTRCAVGRVARAETTGRRGIGLRVRHGSGGVRRDRLPGSWRPQLCARADRSALRGARRSGDRRRTGLLSHAPWDPRVRDAWIPPRVASSPGVPLGTPGLRTVGPPWKSGCQTSLVSSVERSSTWCRHLECRKSEDRRTCGRRAWGFASVLRPAPHPTCRAITESANGRQIRGRACCTFLQMSHEVVWVSGVAV